MYIHVHVCSDSSGSISQSVSIDFLPLSDPSLNQKKASASVTSNSVLSLNRGISLRGITPAGQYITATLNAQPQMSTPLVMSSLVSTYSTVRL